MRAVVYCRLSKEDRQGKREGIDSIAVQTADATRAVQEQGWTLVKVIVDDDVSGTVIDRPGLTEVRSLAKKRQADVLVVRDLDRFSRFEPGRTMGMLTELSDSGMKVWSYRERQFVNLSGFDSMKTYLLALHAEDESKKASARIKDALRARARDGRAVKKPAYGYRITVKGEAGKRWEIDPIQREAVLMVGRTFVECGSLNGTASILNDKGIKSPSGAPWRNTMVAAILRRPIYRGVYQHDDLRIEHPELRIWPPDLEKKIDAKRGAPMKSWGMTPRHLSTRFIRCGVCGGAFVSTASARSKSMSLVCDRQRSRACSGVGYKNENLVDRALLAAVTDTITDEIWERTKALFKAGLEAQREADNHANELEALKKEIRASERRVQGLTESIAEAEDKAARAPLISGLAGEQKRLEGLKAQLAHAKALPSMASPESILEEAERRVQELRSILAKGGIEALPAVSAICGDQKFKVERDEEGRWSIRARISTAHLFEVPDNGQKSAIKGSLPSADDAPAATPEMPASPKP